MEITEISHGLHWEAAHGAVRAATRHAEQLGIRVQAAVTDRAGLLARGLAARQRLVMFGGGLPVVVDDRCVGGVGVSGGREAEDEECAQAALEAIRVAAASSKAGLLQSGRSE